jgi:hypothetical protein
VAAWLNGNRAWGPAVLSRPKWANGLPLAQASLAEISAYTSSLYQTPPLTLPATNFGGAHESWSPTSNEFTGRINDEFNGWMISIARRDKSFGDKPTSGRLFPALPGSMHESF